ncbi:protein ERGIC-53-like [Carcharodon carcharias]|uniref:protein ERGIC-53-like n=1 Tax=Carcharodon carcharias TaxID=13397 RepID=UPI001B7F1604|nr:protein ERGIC-53-like [Carcharodon carcharias]
MVGCAWALVALVCLIPARTSSQEAERPNRRFEYKYSFKGPHLVLQDGTVPFWIYYGNALPSSERVRVVPSLRSQSGSIWSKNDIAFENWEVEVSFRISGRNRIGADGLAIWFTRERGPTGPVYGAADHWDGAGIFFDSYDNDGKMNNPAILVVGNDGQHTYDHLNDGASQALGSCIRDFRNTYHPIRTRIRYFQKTLQVYVNVGMNNFNENYEFCTEVQNMNLPSSGYFGVSAATGGVADDHDVLSFLAFSLTKPETKDPSNQISNKEQEEYHKEYERFEKDLEKRKDEFQKEHPELHVPDEDAFETESQRELQMVAGGQSLIHQQLKKLRERLDVAFEEQMQYSENLSKLGKELRTTTAMGTSEQDADGSHQSLMLVLNGQKAMIQQVQEIRTSMADILAKVKQGQQSLNTVTADKDSISEINEHIHIVKKDVDSLTNIKVQHVTCPKVPPVPSCTSVWHFLAFIALQSIFFLSYLMHRSKRETSYKKYF